MYITLKELNQVTFPVFRLPTNNWSETDGLLYLDEYGFLDDRNVNRDTLGQRRLVSPFNDKMFRLNKAIWDLNGILKQNGLYFIDNTGKPFSYLKTRYCKLVYHAIKRVEGKGSHSLLFVSGMKRTFKIPRPPLPEQQWAGIIYYYGFPWFLYEYSATQKKATRRKV